MGKQPLQKSRLGRGLSSLINTSAPVPDPVGENPAEAPAGSATTMTASSVAPVTEVRVVDVPIDDLVPNPHQPRRIFDEGALKELADSIRTTGVIQPVVARATNEGRLELIAGERRLRAAKIAGLTTLPVILKKVDPVMQAQMALVENLQRTDLNPVERATAYRALLVNLGLTQAELADRLGEDRSVIGHYLRLLELPSKVQNMIATGRLSMSHARLLAGVSGPDEQLRLAELVLSQDLNVRNLERMINSPAHPTTAATAAAAPSAHLIDLEKTLSRHLGMRVQVKASPGKKRGRLIVHYASLDQFDDLMNRLGIAAE